MQHNSNKYRQSCSWSLAIGKSECEQVVASEQKDPICHSDACQIGSFSSEATKCNPSSNALPSTVNPCPAEWFVSTFHLFEVGTIITQYPASNEEIYW